MKTELLSSFSDARERSKESFSESEPSRCLPAHTPKKTARTRHPTSQPFSKRAHRPLRTLPPIPSPSTQRFSDEVEIVGCAGGKDSIEGFQFRCTAQTHLFSSSLGVPKLSACAAGIESVRYDFDRISLVTFPEGIPLGLSRKESDIFRYNSPARPTGDSLVKA